MQELINYFSAPTNNIALSGSGKDTDGYIAEYKWKQVGGPASIIFGNAFDDTTTVTLPEFGIYQIECKVTDNDGAIAKDSVTFVVSANGDPCAGCWD